MLGRGNRTGIKFLMPLFMSLKTAHDSQGQRAPIIICAFLQAAEYTFNELPLLIIAARRHTASAEAGIILSFNMLQNKKISRRADEYASKVDGRTEDKILAKTNSSQEPAKLLRLCVSFHKIRNAARPAAGTLVRGTLSL